MLSEDDIVSRAQKDPNFERVRIGDDAFDDRFFLYANAPAEIARAAREPIEELFRFTLVFSLSLHGQQLVMRARRQGFDAANTIVSSRSSTVSP